MLTSKQRSYLKSLAHHENPIVFIGKEGVTDNVVKEVDTCLENKELIKVKLQESCDLNPKEVANELARTLTAEFVQAIGHKFCLYRQAKDKEKRRIVLPK